MKFSLIALLACAVTAIASPTQLVSRADKSIIIVDFQIMTTKSGDLQKRVAGLNLLNFILFGYSIKSGLENITQTAEAIVSEATPPLNTFSAPDARDVVGVLATFVRAYEELLSTLIDKHDLFKLFGATEPIKTQMGLFEFVDFSSLLALISPELSEATFRLNSLHTSLDDAISAYSF